MLIRLYKVKSGDCILLKFQDKNVIFDAGFVITAKDTLFRIFDEVKENKERINLIVLTHTDRDHISGIKALARRKDLLCLADQVWMNYPNTVTTNTRKEVSFQEANTVASIFVDNGVSMISDIHNQRSEVEHIFEDLNILSPSKVDLEDFEYEWEKVGTIQVASQKGDWEKSIDSITFENVTIDSSPNNKVSIALYIKVHDTKILLLGDSYPDKIEKKIRELGYYEENRLQVDYLKLSHHGSKFNLTCSLLDCLDVQNYLLSSNGSYLDKTTIAMIAKHPKRDLEKKVRLYFNYHKSVYVGLLSDDEMKKYNIECLYASEEQEFIEVESLDNP